MKYCSSCGSQVQEGVAFCPNCGNKIDAQSNNAAVNNNQNFASRLTVQNRSIVTAILLSIVTCGIYGIIWFISMVNDVNRVCNDEKSGTSGGMVFLLSLITLGIYGIIWFYQVGKRMHDAGQKYGIQIENNSVLYLVLMLFGLGIINYCLVQTDLNKFSA